MMTSYDDTVCESIKLNLEFPVEVCESVMPNFNLSVQVDEVCESTMPTFHFSVQVGDVCESVMPNFHFSGDVCESVMTFLLKLATFANLLCPQNMLSVHSRGTS